ncbi:hypothetical protein [Lentibacter sp. XHP0401]|uniref:hypothetical protein n=1 Tax=Lentibacter sp. XHP0401 TaxID=2984334 RepID=UPI0021E9667B|nr:hypothetical protein [Lentibacter sp. XHP0401]MCV2893006.1 hypothetical protein [Lentibacter sp. XHP0401]
MMMTDHKHVDDTMLDEMFAAARADAPEPDAALLARVLEDAADVQAGFATASVPRAPRRARGSGFFDMIGGWTGLGGLVAASSFGLWLGMSSMPGLTDTFGLPGYESAAALESLGDDYEYLAALGEF